MSTASLPSEQLDGKFVALERLYNEQSITTLENGVQSGQRLLDKILAPLNVAKGQHQKVDKWISSIETLKKEATPRKTFIGVVGSTGAGKSSVINALLDEEVFVPTNSMRACTAVVVEIHYNDSISEDELYKAEVQFISAEEWEKELSILIEELYDGNELVRNHSDPDSPAGVAFAQIRAVYPTISHEDLRKSRPTAKELAAHPSIEDVLGKSKVISARTARDLYTQVNVFVDSEKKKSTRRSTEPPEIHHWPLTKQVQLFTKSPMLKPDLVLVDLPGTGDNNAARGAVAAKYIQKCDGLWVVAPITRAVDEKAAHKLMNDSFRKQLHLDGTYGNITFICSKTDDISPREMLRELKDSEDDPELSAEIQDLENDQQETERLEQELEEMEDVMEPVPSQIAHLSAEIEKLDDGISALEAALKSPSDQPAQVVVYVPKNHSSASARGKRKTPRKDSRAARKRSRNCNPDDEYVDDSNNVDSPNDHEFAEESGSESDSNPAKLGVHMNREEAESQLVEHRQQREEFVKSKKELQLTRMQSMEQASVLKSKIKAQKNTLALWCIRYRNGWSRPRIKKQFAQGMQDMVEEDLANLDDNEGTAALALEKLDSKQIEEALDVFCVSSRAYQTLHRRLKVGGKSLQKLSVFRDTMDTEIPQLREHAQKCTQITRASTCKAFLRGMNSILGSLVVHLIATEDSLFLPDNTRQAELDHLETTSTKLEDGLKDTARDLELALNSIFDISICSRLGMSVRQANAKASTIIIPKWGGSEDSPGKCKWNTYRATCTRGGIFCKGVAPQDFNSGVFSGDEALQPLQAHGTLLITPAGIDLAKPFIDHACARWKNVFQESIPAAMDRYSTMIERHLEEFEKSMRARSQLRDAHVLHNQLGNFKNRMKDHTGIKAMTTEVRKGAHRDTLPTIAAEMAPTYQQCTMERGPGMFKRMKSVMKSAVEQVVPSMYQKSADTMSHRLKQTVAEIKEHVDNEINETMLEIRGNYSTFIVKSDPFKEIERAKQELRNLLATADDSFSEDLSAKDLSDEDTSDEDTSDEDTSEEDMSDEDPSEEDLPSDG